MPFTAKKSLNRGETESMPCNISPLDKFDGPPVIVENIEPDSVGSSASARAKSRRSTIPRYSEPLGKMHFNDGRSKTWKMLARCDIWSEVQ